VFQFTYQYLDNRRLWHKSESTVTRLRVRRQENRTSIPGRSIDSSVTTSSKLALKSTQLSRYSDWLRAGRRRGRSSRSDRVKNFLFSMSSRPAVGFTQPPIQCVPWVLSWKVKWSGREADDSPPTVPRSRKYGSIHPLPHTPSWLSA
jgi:hypothetical protein